MKATKARKMPPKKGNSRSSPSRGGKRSHRGAAGVPDPDLGQTQTLREFLATAGELTRDQRLTIVEQARIMIEQTYVHLPLKRAMHAVDPVQRLRLLKQRLDGYSERQFHDEMISIFTHLRDLHTNYILPDPYRSRVAFLPFRIEECFEPPAPGSSAAQMPIPQYVVTEIIPGVADAAFTPGVVITSWNGVHIDRAIEINAEREAGSNLDARHAQGLESMTNRWMGMSLPPDDEWVIIRYRTAPNNSPERETRFDWQVFMPPPPPGGGGGAVPGADRLAAGDPALRRMGIDAKTEMQRRVRKLLFAPRAVEAERHMAELGARASQASQAFHRHATANAFEGARYCAPELGSATGPVVDFRSRRPKTRSRPASKVRPGSSAEAGAVAAGAVLEGVDLTANSIIPDVFSKFGKVTTPSGTFGYIRIVTFAVGDVDGFIQEFIRLASLLPQDGLIIDVRGNGGGTIAAGEGLLQTLTPGPITPERFHLIDTPLILEMCELDPELAVWKESVAQAVETGSTFSQGFPLTPVDFCNSIGQVYQGPVLLIIDARCYSTTDMFSAGFQDHRVGVILGTAGHTGAGGANVWEHNDLEQALPTPSSPFQPIPQGASFRVAIRRSTRVGERSGQPLEDLGVTPDVPVYRMTRTDLLNGNLDLISHAGELLATMPKQRLIVKINSPPGAPMTIEAKTTNLTRLDALVGRRPVKSVDVADGTITLEIPSAANTPPNQIEIQGFRNGMLVASSRLA